jgi:hypothetical protein
LKKPARKTIQIAEFLNLKNNNKKGLSAVPRSEACHYQAIDG